MDREQKRELVKWMLAGALIALLVGAVVTSQVAPHVFPKLNPSPGPGAEDARLESRGDGDASSHALPQSSTDPVTAGGTSPPTPATPPSGSTAPPSPDQAATERGQDVSYVAGRIAADIDGDGSPREEEYLVFVIISFTPEPDVAGNTAQSAEATSSEGGSWAVALHPGAYEVTAQHQNQVDGLTYSATTSLVVGEGGRVTDVLLLLRS